MTDGRGRSSMGNKDEKLIIHGVGWIKHGRARTNSTFYKFHSPVEWFARGVWLAKRNCEQDTTGQRTFPNSFAQSTMNIFSRCFICIRYTIRYIVRCQTESNNRMQHRRHLVEMMNQRVIFHERNLATITNIDNIDKNPTPLPLSPFHSFLESAFNLACRVYREIGSANNQEIN